MSMLKPLPKSMPSPLGPIPIRTVKKLRDKSGALMGKYFPNTRTIHLRKGMVPHATRQVLWHEWIHSVLFDAGVQLDRRDAEHVCDALGTALAAYF